MSPNRPSETDSTKGLETPTSLPDQSSVVKHSSAVPVNMQSNSITYPDDVIPVQSRGYMHDLQNVGDVNPFQGSNKMANSPSRASGLPMTRTSELTVSHTSTVAACAPKDDQIVLEASNTPLPFVLSVENSLADHSSDISSAEGTVIFKNNNEKSVMDTEKSDVIEPAEESQQVPLMGNQPQVWDSPLPPAGSYNLDFDNLDSFNPFQTGGSKIPNSHKLEEDVETSAASRPGLQNQTIEPGVTPSEDEFVPGALFMPARDFDGQIDYLEQFGSSTFESALRKQSLYLKFDPLLKDSPMKTVVESSEFSWPRPSLAIRMMEAAKSQGQQKSQCNTMKLLEDFAPPAVDTVVPDLTVLDLLVPTLKQPVRTVDSIIEVLKYSQRDMDAALQEADRQAKERQQQLNAQTEALRLENQHMLFVVSEFEATITQITEEHKQKEDLAKTELERVLQEKDQLTKDLNDLERSFSSLVKRLDKCKNVMEGFKKNEETLKQYAHNCMERLQNEEKRYLALKGLAEEKLDQANKVIADVRIRMETEVATLQVQLRREQLKVQSLEKDLEQKDKEVRDVTELCDELLLKVQRHVF